jgi:beta-1,4-mannosyltransferase
MASAAPGRPWVIIAAYPAWPSPYFADLARHAPEGLPLAFRPDLASLDPAWQPGVINLHRLKRLYRDPATGSATTAGTQGFLDRLARLKNAGWKLAWTVHNLLPIDGAPPGPADRMAASGVLALADAVLCHTASDARWIEQHAGVRTWVTGWSCLDPPSGPPEPPIAELAAQMRSWQASFLILGHITGYKDIPAVARAFLASTRAARLAIAGDCHDPRAAGQLHEITVASRGRVTWYPRQVAPGQAGYLYAAALAAVCPYRSDGPFGFFADVLHPSSVGTAAGFGVPVIAPALPSVQEITQGQPRWLAQCASMDGLGPAMAAAEADLLTNAATVGDPRDRRARAAPGHQWRQLAATYQQAAGALMQPARE